MSCIVTRCSTKMYCREKLLSYSARGRREIKIIVIVIVIVIVTSNGRENVLVMTDVYSKFTIARNQTAQTVAKALVRECFFR